MTEAILLAPQPEVIALTALEIDEALARAEVTALEAQFALNLSEVEQAVPAETKEAAQVTAVCKRPGGDYPYSGWVV